MNRIEALLAPTDSQTELSRALAIDFHPEADSLNANRFASLPEAPPLASFAPMNYEPGYAYPLVVWMHGAGQNEDGLAPVMANLSTRNYVAVAPRGPGLAHDPWEEAGDAEHAVFEAIEAASEKFNVNSDRVFVIGADSGGTAALRVALSHPEQFAGAASFDGPAPTGGMPLRRINAVRGLPVMLACGSESLRYPEPRVCQDLRLLYSAGCSLNVRQEPGDGDLTTGALAELNRWMMAIVCGG